MKRLLLLAVLTAGVVAACGGSGGGGELAEAPTASTSEPGTAPADTSAEAAPKQGEEFGERQDLGGGDNSEGTTTASEPRPAGEPRQEDTSRPLAPVISGDTLSGEPISFEDFLGTPIVVKVFAET